MRKANYEHCYVINGEPMEEAGPAGARQTFPTVGAGRC